MKKKPRGPRYRSLTARGSVIYYKRVIGGKRIRFSCHTDDWNRASEVARLYEERKGINRLPILPRTIPRLREFAERYRYLYGRLRGADRGARRAARGKEAEADDDDG